MKLRYILLTFFISGLLFSASGQVHLRITNLSRLPVAPTDTAYESQTYDSIQIQVQNIGNSPLNSDNISILIQGNPASGPDILYEDTAVLFTITQGNAANINASGFVFKPTHFDDGDNIVVVWPAARFTPYITDTLTFHVYFVSMLAGIDDQEKDPVVIAPNPMNEYIAIRFPSESGAKQVRITDILGRPVIHLKDGYNYIPTSEWNAGLYFLQYTDASGKSVSRRLLKY